MARGIPCWDSQGNPVPVSRPLRSDRHPDGIPDLPPGDARRVRLANESYLALRQAVRLGLQRGILIAVENPRSSLFWKTSFWRDVAHAFSPCGSPGAPMVATVPSSPGLPTRILLSSPCANCVPAALRMRLGASTPRPPTVSPPVGRPPTLVS
ncbi:unnamed protein product [Symbiodinium natans]|uniref:Uncharacterized protein n=1 Tax=Symbiodinium natans TaxID=878477 RepID=A0A812M1X1_9DINO|nr:unnamed protein product [Symbiodinium natans]